MPKIHSERTASQLLSEAEGGRAHSAMGKTVTESIPHTFSL